MITASTGDTCRAAPSTYAAYGVTSAITVSRTGSVTRLRSRTAPAASTPPAAAPPAVRTANRAAPCSSTLPAPAEPAVPATAKDTAIWNKTRLVPSLNRLSACTSACTRGGSDSRRPSALTATGSVLASTAPSTNARLAGIPATAPATTATAPADASTRPTDRMTTGRHTARSSRHGSSSLAAYSSGGSTTRLTAFRAHPDRRDPRQQADHQPGDHQQRRGRDAEAAGEGRDDRAQHDQEQDDLDIAHAADPRLLDPQMDECRPDFPARRYQAIRRDLHPSDRTVSPGWTVS